MVVCAIFLIKRVLSCDSQKSKSKFQIEIEAVQIFGQWFWNGNCDFVRKPRRPLRARVPNFKRLPANKYAANDVLRFIDHNGTRTSIVSANKRVGHNRITDVDINYIRYDFILTERRRTIRLVDENCAHVYFPNITTSDKTDLTLYTCRRDKCLFFTYLRFPGDFRKNISKTAYHNTPVWPMGCVMFLNLKGPETVYV